MDWQNKLNHIIDYLETEISGGDDIDLTKAARHAGFSLWEYQRLFSFLTNITVGSYIRKRRMTLAADDILNSNEKIIDIAINTVMNRRQRFHGHLINYSVFPLLTQGIIKHCSHCIQNLPYKL